MEKMFEIPVGMSAMECFYAKMFESLFGSFNGLHEHETSILVEAMKRGDEESIRKLADVTHSDVATVRDCIGRHSGSDLNVMTQIPSLINIILFL